MNILTAVIHYILPLLSFILLLLGLTKKRTNYVLIALWISMVSLLLEYQTAGGEILGSYFGYKNAAIYTLNLLILISALLFLGSKLPMLKGKYVRYTSGFFGACLITASILLIINLWINARFIENRLPGTAIMQVVSFTPPNYCSYRYVFYKVGSTGKVSYLCPNHYGLIPSIGHLELAPDFIVRQLAQQAQLKHKIRQQSKHLK